MRMTNDGSHTAPSPEHNRRTVLVMALAGAGAGLVGCGGGSGSGSGGETLPTFVDPASVADYMATMKLGTQAGDYLEMPEEAQGLVNAVGDDDFQRMRNEAGFDHIRIPANCAARADVTGLVSEDFLVKVDTQVIQALARFERVVLDPLHHYAQWIGDHTHDKFYTDYVAVAALTADQHAVRATAIWVQLATRYKNFSSRLSFDLFNEPSQVRQQAGYPLGLSAAQLNDWYAAVIPEIRKTGGNNAQRMIWLQPWGGRLDKLEIPSDAGALGVAPHYYNPTTFTLGVESISAAGLSDYVEAMKYAKRWGAANNIAMWVGESGVSRNVSGGQVPRPDADRAEFIAHVRNTGLTLSMPICYWAYNNNFALYDQQGQAWLPSMLQAVTGKPGPLPVREIAAFAVLTGGRIARAFDANPTPGGFVYTAETGVLTAPANTANYDRDLVLVFPDIAVSSGESWIVRAVDFSGEWRIGNCACYHDATQADKNGVLGLDHRAQILSGGDVYPQFRAFAPGGFENVYGDTIQADTFLGIDVLLPVGSPGGYINFECIRVV